MATDEEAYKAFGDLFQPVIKDIHPEFDYRFNYKYDDLKYDIIEEQLSHMKQCIKQITDYRFEVSRNFKNTPFTPLMTKESKLQVERKVVEVLGSLYGTYNQVQKINESDAEWLSSINIDPKNTSEEFDAAGINDDWPVGRGIFIHDNRKWIILINFEEHIKIVVLKDKEDEADTFNEGIRQLFKLVELFEKFGFANDQYLGNLTVSPKNLGTALNLFCEFNLHATDEELDRQILMDLQHRSHIKYDRHSETLHSMTTLKTLAAGYNEMIQTSDFLK